MTNPASPQQKTTEAEAIAASKATLVRVTPLGSDGGFARYGRIETKQTIGSIRLFEDGVELGPQEPIHAAIRELGGGRYYLSEDWLRFSASDNSDPKTNGRSYYALISPDTTGLTMALDAALSWPESIPVVTRHKLLKRLANAIYPAFSLPDFGRQVDSDRALYNIIERFYGDDMPNITVDRRYGLRELAKLAIDIEGDFAECGSYNGVTAWLMADVMRASPHPKELHLFDSFEGLSVPGEQDGSYWQKGDLTFPLEKVKENLSAFDNVRYHPGWIPDAFPEVQDLRFAFVHIDVDLFEPTRDALRFFWDRLTIGGLIVSDDYGLISCPGATKAFDDFFANKPEPIVNLASGGAFIMKRS